MAKIYISSTYIDLKDYREEVYRALRKLRHDVIAMEDYTASDERPLDKCLADVDGCDIYIGIFAWRYGYIPPGEKKSITELEFRRAANRKKCLIFILDDNAPWSRALMDREAGRIETLREEMKKDFMAEFFSNKDELASDVAIAITKALASNENTVANNLVGVGGKESSSVVKEVLEAQKPFFTAAKIIAVGTLLAMIACSFSSSITNGIGLPMAFMFICVFSFSTIGGLALFSIKMAEIYRKA